MIFIGTYRTYPVLGVLAVVGAAITAVYILRMLGAVFFGPIDEDKWKDLTDANKTETGVAVLLTGFLLLWGLYPFRIVEIIDSGVVPIMEGLGG
jgi:NADH:ubiquinone oxidoreductase subunit 4 (subunit M)